MTKIIDEEFWVFDPAVLFKTKFFPESLMTRPAKLNAMTRLVLVIFFVLFLLKIKYNHIFLILSILFIILLNYTKMNRENFSEIRNQNSQGRKDFQPFQSRLEGYNMLQNRNMTNFANTNAMCAKSNYAYDKLPPFEANKYVNVSQQTQKTNGLLQDNRVAKREIPYDELKKLSTFNKTDVGVDFYAPPIEIQERSLIPPMIVPRALDSEVWSPNDYKISNIGKLNREDYVNLTPNVGIDKFCPKAAMDVKMNSSKSDPTNLLEYTQDFPVIADYVNMPTDVKVFSDIQPYKDGTITPASRQPINANYGISAIPSWDMSSEKKYYTQEADKFYSKSDVAEKTQQIAYDRYDPQLIRDYGPEGRKAEQPLRSEWSARLHPYEAKNPPDFNSVFDPRFTGYGDPYRSYLDADLGQISYFYGDINAYKHPVFVTRSKVDFIEQRQPMGKIEPLYLRDRSMCLDEAVEMAQDRWFTDTTQFREGLMASQMQKRNGEMWQNRYAPLSLRPT